MLQQTQVERVLPLYKNFIRLFPTPQHLARVPLARVLVAWQGLGYNRRAKMLHQAAKELCRRGMSSDVRELETLPGVGPYTASALVAFVFNQDSVLVETNIRTAITHHFLPGRRKVSDKEIKDILVEVLPRGKAREWYSALMDYGAHLKQSGVRLNTRSRHYTGQSKFLGSTREARGVIVRKLSAQAASRTHLVNLLGSSRRAQMHTALERLEGEGLVRRSGRKYALAS